MKSPSVACLSICSDQSAKAFAHSTPVFWSARANAKRMAMASSVVLRRIFLRYTALLSPGFPLPDVLPRLVIGHGAYAIVVMLQALRVALPPHFIGLPLPSPSLWHLLVLGHMIVPAPLAAKVQVAVLVSSALRHCFCSLGLRYMSAKQPCRRRSCSCAWWS